MRRIDAVLFDFDGTLADSSEDLAGALNAVRVERGEPVLDIDFLRPHTAQGARSMIAAAYGHTPAHPDYRGLRERFLTHYEQGMLNTTHVWPGMQSVLDTLDARGIAWGIVTNKFSRFAEKVVAHLNINPKVLVCGDTTPTPKPHPAPLLYAAEQLKQSPLHCIYVGDALGDMQAAKAAGMLAVAAGYSYFVSGHDRAAWAADRWIESPGELLTLMTT